MKILRTTSLASNLLVLIKKECTCKNRITKKNEKLISIDFQIAHVVSDYLSISDFTERHFKTYAEANSSHS